MNTTMPARLRIPLSIVLITSLLAWGIGIPVRADDPPTDTEGPAITEMVAAYPDWFSPFIGGQQDSYKFGDKITIIVEATAEAGVESVGGDFSELGIPDPIPLRINTNRDSTHWQYIAVPSVNSHADGIVAARVTVTDMLGRTATKSVNVRLDNTPPAFTLGTLSFANSTSTPVLDDTVLLSGKIDSNESKVFAWNSYYSLYDASGTQTLLVGSLRPKQAVDALSPLGAGTFTNYPVQLWLDPKTTAFEVPDASYISITATLLDGAGNKTYATSSLARIPHTGDAPGGVSNVLFLPGIEGSRLYAAADGCDARVSDCAEEKIWEPQSDVGAHSLFLDENGKTIRTLYTKEDDVLAQAHDPHALFSENLYTSFFAHLDSLTQQGEMARWEPIAYDWRLSMDALLSNGRDINGKIFYGESTSTPYIEQELRSLAATSKTGKVTIIAHSNGGLLAKALMRKLGDTETTRLVDQVVLVGAPQSGAPEGVASLLYGYGTALPFDRCATVPLIGPLCQSLLSRSTTRTFAEHSPMAYQLLPSQRYFDDVPDPAHPVVRFDSTIEYPNEIAFYGPRIDSNDELSDFLQAADGGRTKPDASDTGKANVITELNLLAYGRNMHDSLDGWVPPASVRVHEIAGWGADTLAGIEYYIVPSLHDLLSGLVAGYRPVFTEDGDGTVPVPSALEMPGSSQVQPYWLKLGSDAAGTHAHADLFESPALQQLIDSILNHAGALPDGVQITRPDAHDARKRLVFVLHGQGSLALHDANGNADVDATYGTFGSETYAIAAAGAAYDLLITSLANAPLTLDVQSLEANVIAGMETFSDIPATASTTATLSGTDLEDSAAIDVDEDGDGTPDTTVLPDPADTAPPESATSTDSSTATSTASTTTDTTGTEGTEHAGSGDSSEPAAPPESVISKPPVLIIHPSVPRPPKPKQRIQKPAEKKSAPVKKQTTKAATTTNKASTTKTQTAATLNAPASQSFVQALIASVYSILNAIIGILAKMAAMITSHS